MAETISTPIMTPQSYLAMFDESAWGDMPGSPTYIHVPVFEYGVDLMTETREATPFTGLYQEKHLSNVRGLPMGPIRTALYGWHPTGLNTSLMQYLLDWCLLQQETQLLTSKGFEWAEGPDLANRRHLGCRPDSVVLAGSEQSKIVTLDINIKGRSEETFATAQTLPTNRNKLVEVEFPDCSFQINNADVKIQAFALQIQHGLLVSYLNSNVPTLLVKTMRRAILTMVPVKQADTYNALMRLFSMNEFPGQIVLRGLHNGTGTTGTKAVATISIPRMGLLKQQAKAGQNQLLFQPLTFKIMKPDSASNDMSIAYSEE